MSKLEKALLGFLDKYRFAIIIFFTFIFSALLRYILLDYYSSDMTDFLLPWIDEINAGGGVSALSTPIGNYPIPYMLLLVAAANLPIEPSLTIKLYSIIADYALAVAIGLIVYRILSRTESRGKSRRWAVGAAALTTLLPLPILNSALWGQCDSIYTLFLILALYFAIQDKWLAAMLLFSISFAFKLQALFLLPFFIIMYISSRRYSILSFALIPIPVFLATLPFAMQNGNLLLALEIYKGQAVGDDRIFNDFFNISILFNNIDSQFMKPFLIVLAISMCFLMFAFVWATSRKIEGDSLLLLACFSVMTCVMFLPNMHERYGYAGELFAWAWFIAKPSVKRSIPAVVFSFTAISAYLSFLGGYWIFDINMLSIFNIAAYIALCIYMIQAVVKSPSCQNNRPVWSAAKSEGD